MLYQLYRVANQESVRLFCQGFLNVAGCRYFCLKMSHVIFCIFSQVAWFIDSLLALETIHCWKNIAFSAVNTYCGQDQILQILIIITSVNVHPSISIIVVSLVAQSHHFPNIICKQGSILSLTTIFFSGA